MRLVSRVRIVVAGAQVSGHHVDKAGFVGRLALGRNCPEPFKTGGVYTPRLAKWVDGACPSVRSGLDLGQFEAVTDENANMTDARIWSRFIAALLF
jgi:hypothetical protein